MHLQGAVSGLQGAGARHRNGGGGAGRRQARAKGAGRALPLPVPRGEWLLRLCSRSRPRQGQGAQEADQRHDKAQKGVPPLQGGGIPDVNGLHPQGPPGQKTQGGFGHHRR